MIQNKLKNFKFAFAFLSFFSAIAPSLVADSPLTSTGFWIAYQDEKIVKYARFEGKMNRKIAKFLMDKNEIMGLKAAVCNALGWKFEGQNNAFLFLKYLSAEYNFKEERIEWDLLSADELACYGYLVSMDDYFNPAQGITTLNLAIKKNSNSKTIKILHALVKAQIAFESDWCAVFTLMNEVINDHLLVNDLNDAAIKIITDYISLYKSSCS